MAIFDINEKKVKKGDIIEGTEADIDGLILKVEKIKRSNSMIMRTLENKNSKFSNPNEMDEHKIGGLCDRGCDWSHCFRIIRPSLKHLLMKENKK